MKQHPVIKILVVAGVFMMALLVVIGLKPVSQNEMTVSTHETIQSPAVTDTLSRVPATVAPITEPAAQSPRQNWYARLSSLHGIGKLFGVKGEERMRQLQDFVESLDAADVPAAVKELQELQTSNPTDTGRDLRLRLLQKWAESDVHSAGDWAKHMPAGGDRQEAMATLAGQWAKQDFDEATAWANGLSDVTEKQGALEGVADAAVYRNPTEALRLARTLEASSARDDIIIRAVGIWALKTPEAALLWTKNIPDERLREQAMTSVAINWAITNPIAAANLAATSLQPGTLQDAAIIAVVQRWSRTDEPGAKAWVTGFPEGKLRQTAMATLRQISKGGHVPALRDGQ